MAEDVMQKFLEWLKAQRDDEYATFNEAVRTEGVSESEIDGCMTRAQVYARCADNCRHLLSEASNHKSENREYEMKDIDIVVRVLHELTEKHLTRAASSLTIRSTGNTRELNAGQSPKPRAKSRRLSPRKESAGTIHLRWVQMN